MDIVQSELIYTMIWMAEQQAVLPRDLLVWLVCPVHDTALMHAVLWSVHLRSLPKL